MTFFFTCLFLFMCVCVCVGDGREVKAVVAWKKPFVFQSLHAQLDSQMGLMVGSMQSDGVSGTRDEV